MEKLSEYKYKIPRSYKPGMLVDGIIYADQTLIPSIEKDKASEQVANVAFLPGIVKYSLAMPDIHWGYGFPIGGVAATDIEAGGVLAPGGIGFDICCGIRLVRTDLSQKEIEPKLSRLADTLYNIVPAGVGSKGKVKASGTDEKKLIIQGADWAVQRGMGVESDLECCEEQGALPGADPDAISERAYMRGRAQSGTLGSGNHFLEVQVIDQVYEPETASRLGLEKGNITVMIHSGSRGFGYQVCDDYLKTMAKCLTKYNIQVPDRQLACAPVNSPEAQQYLSAMNGAANYAWCNRQVLMHLARKSFEKIFDTTWQDLGMNLIYDVSHNIAKIEKHMVDGKEKTLCVHRKGATRSFGPGNPAIPVRYRDIGQPVIIPGDMGTASYLLVGTKQAEEETWGSTCHGAGRVKSRHEALRTIDFQDLMNEMTAKGIQVRATGKRTVVEEAPSAYKDIDAVVNVVHNAGLSRRICRMKPLAVIKG